MNIYRARWITRAMYSPNYVRFLARQMYLNMILQSTEHSNAVPVLCVQCYGREVHVCKPLKQRVLEALVMRRLAPPNRRR